jgi:hypothetical protein
MANKQETKVSSELLEMINLSYRAKNDLLTEQEKTEKDPFVGGIVKHSINKGK